MTLPLGIVASGVNNISSNGSLDPSFNVGSGINAGILSVKIQSNGRILAGGDFTSWNNITTDRFVGLNSNGTRDESFMASVGTGTVQPDHAIYDIAFQSSGKMILISPSTWNGTSAKYILRLNSDGTRDTAFDTNIGLGPNDVCFGLAIQPDDKILVGGYFTSWNGTPVSSMVRLNSNGTLDTAFNTNIGTGPTGPPLAFAIQSDGKILVGGGFYYWNGSENQVGGIVRLNSNGTLDTAFSTNIGVGSNSEIKAFAIQSDGKILVGGGFTYWNGSPAGAILRLNSDGTRDTAFDIGVGTGAASWSYVYTLAIQSDGKILVGGSFATWNGTSAGYIVRLNSGGTRDTAFDTAIGTGAQSAFYIYTLAIQSDGKILVGGWFSSWNGTPANHLVRLLAI